MILLLMIFIISEVVIFDSKSTSILDRYKNFNNTEGNSVTTDNSPESYPTAASSPT